MVAKTLGTPLMPWQQLAADVALERNADGSYHYPIVVITVPRQSGKTTLLRAIAVQQMMAHRRREIYFTAQTGKDATARWRQLVEKIESNRVASNLFDVRLSAGSPWIMHKRTRSKFMPFAPGGDSLHGYTPHVVMIDEAFSLDELEARVLMGAVRPAQSTIRTRQLYIVSTKGTAESVFLHDWIKRGRAGEPGVALIEYGAAPGVDAYDPDEWWNFHPGLGMATTEGGLTEEYLREEAATLPRSEFERGYANRETLTLSHLVPQETWDPLESDAKVPAGAATALTYDVAYDQSAATVMLSWVDRDDKFAGVLRHRILERHAGVEWLVDAVKRHRLQLKPDVVAADDGGPARGFTAELTRAGLEVATTDGSEFATAYGRWMIRLRTGQMSHDGTEPFWLAVAGLVTRPVTDAIAPSRRHSSGDISPVVAAIVAGIKLEQLTTPYGKPVIDFGGDAA
ncbi:conserved hypothetical protein [Aeromicrobium sp. 9AM]|nr:conserved hypothetical protein [Aeromicrobium sp. 9AM]